jgi:hypothetical protein
MKPDGVAGLAFLKNQHAFTICYPHSSPIWKERWFHYSRSSLYHHKYSFLPHGIRQDTVTLAMNVVVGKDVNQNRRICMGHQVCGVQSLLECSPFIMKEIFRR